MDAELGLSWLTPRRRRVLRLALLLSVFIWLFVRPLRESISMWIPFAALAGIEIHFFGAGLRDWRRRAPPIEAGHRADLDPLSREEIGTAGHSDLDEVIVVDDVLSTCTEDCGPDSTLVDGVAAEKRLLLRFLPAWPFEAVAAALTLSWLFVGAVRTTVPALAVLAAASLLAAHLVAQALRSDAERVVSRPQPVLAHLRQLAVVVLIAGAVFLMVRPSGWDALGAARQSAGESVFSRESSRIVGRPVSIVCDRSGAHTGVLNDADGSAIVGGKTAWLDPRICMTLYNLEVKRRVDSFDATSWAILVLAHESWHLRGQGNEGVTNCFGLQSGVELGRRLGLGSSVAAHMMRYRYEINSSEFSLGRLDYMLPAGCANGGRYDLDLLLRRFP